MTKLDVSGVATKEINKIKDLNPEVEVLCGDEYAALSDEDQKLYRKSVNNTYVPKTATSLVLSGPKKRKVFL
jgi:hypothetical protein